MKRASDDSSPQVEAPVEAPVEASVEAPVEATVEAPKGEQMEEELGENTEKVSESPRKKFKAGEGETIQMDTTVDAIASCDICQIGFSGPESARQHYNGKKHKKQALGLQMGQQSGQAYVFDGKKGRCYICCLAFTSQEDADQHLQGKKHKLQENRLKVRNERKGEAPSNQPDKIANKATTDETGDATSQTKTPDLSEAGDEIMKDPASVKDAKDENAGESSEPVDDCPFDASTNTGYCYICNLALTSYNMHHQHINGAPHKRKLLRREAKLAKAAESEVTPEGDGDAEPQKTDLPDVIQHDPSEIPIPEQDVLQHDPSDIPMPEQDVLHHEPPGNTTPVQDEQDFLPAQPITVIESRKDKIAPISDDDDDDDI